MTLDVVGRRPGRVIAVPVVVIDFDGARYLVSMLGESANWVGNTRAAGGLAALRHGRRERIRLVEVGAALRAPILRRYLQVAPGARPHLPVAQYASLSEFGAITADFPVFRVESTAREQRGGGPSM